ncbi:MAG: trehalose-6-phosphate synthase, partial [Candidatus Omnitrophica bacterium]|nr:trehalose-6-phosphate synthase [Candidatus Omnitrophota bacterium]
VAVAGLLAVFSGFQAWQARQRLKEEGWDRARLLAASLQAPIEMLWSSHRLEALQEMMDRVSRQERRVALALSTTDGQQLAMTAGFPAHLSHLPEATWEVVKSGQRTRELKPDGQAWWYLTVLPVHVGEQVVGALLVAYDTAQVDAQRTRWWTQELIRVALSVALGVVLILLMIQWSVMRPLARIVEWMRRLRTGSFQRVEVLPKSGALTPLTDEVTKMAESWLAARVAAEEEARLRNTRESRWTAERLKEHVRLLLKGQSLMVVSNREPYMHVRQGRQIHCVVPPGGVVTALEPILHACGGTWIAACTGNADRDTADSRGRLSVPPEAPRYTLRRIWLEPHEERGYYYGFANEGLWPLCHIAHTRPLFRSEDWTQYARVNAKFAEAILEEIADTESPFLLIQDYHFALLPSLIKAQRPDARVALFWHIPWPNPEAFGICPWARELLQGMLGADLIGFQIQLYGNNFLSTIDRMLESRIDWEHVAVNRGEHTTWVKPFPISVAWPSAPLEPHAGDAHAPSTLRDLVFKQVGFSVRWLGMGVDRLDYTKGIPERLWAIERVFEKYPALVGQFTMVELGAPSRMLIDRYQHLVATLEAETERINRRFQTKQWKPIVFLKGQHSHEQIAPFYKAADVCLVTSLHDGMNLVSKEFVVARDDLGGVLILSQFTGAARELRDALVVNPYDTEQVADAIQYALTMDPDEQKARMARMRDTVQEHTVYRWASSLMTELARLRLDATKPDVALPVQPLSSSPVG